MPCSRIIFNFRCHYMSIVVHAFVRAYVGLRTYGNTFARRLCVCARAHFHCACTYVRIHACIHVRAPARTLWLLFIRRVSIKFNARRSYNVRTTSPRGQLCHVELDTPVSLSSAIKTRRTVAWCSRRK